MEALNLFEEIISNEIFRNSSIILFLNKTDLFLDKIKICPINSIPAFADYDGKMIDPKDGADYFKSKFYSKNKNPDKIKIYTHLTCATDTQNVSKVLQDCKDIILRESVSKTWNA